MRLKKRGKSSRLRGSHTHARGFKKKARGSGHRGGVGMAGTGKRGDAKKSLIINLYGNDYFGRAKALRRGHIAPKLCVINLSDIELMIPSFLKSGKAKEKSGAYEINLDGYKVLGDGDAKLKLIIKASAASGSAIEKVKKAGGEIIIKKSEQSKPEVKKEAQAEAKTPASKAQAPKAPAPAKK